MKISIQAKLQELLFRFIESEKAVKGNVQLYYSRTDELIIVAQSGFDASFLSHFSIVKPFDSSSCGRAFGAGRTIMINDTNTDLSFTDHRQAAKDAGFQSVKSVPVFGRNQKAIGVISAHFTEPKLFWETKEPGKIISEIAAQLEALYELEKFKLSR